MVLRLQKILGASISNLHQAALVLGLSAVASQVLALLRDRIFAHIFGAGETLDIYYAAFKIPDLLFVSVASLVSMTVLIPYFSKELKANRESARYFLNSVFSVFLFTLILFGLIAFILMPRIAYLVAPGFTSSALGELIQLSRILLLSPLFLGLSGYLASIVHSFGKFIVYALSPILYNIGIIIGALFLYPAFGLSGLAFGVVLGAFLHFAIQWPTVRALGFAPRLTFKIWWPRVREVFTISIPRTLTIGMHQIVTLIFTAMASLISVGSIAIFNLSFNLQSVPLAIIGVSYSMAAFPTLSRYFSNNNLGAFVEQIATTARHIIFWTLPLSGLFIVLRAQIVRTLLGSGNFDWADTRLTAAALALFSISAVFQVLILLFVRGIFW